MRVGQRICEGIEKFSEEYTLHSRISLNVGELDAVRDIMDIKDAVKAIWLLAEKGTPGEVYNIGGKEEWEHDVT